VTGGRKRRRKKQKEKREDEKKKGRKIGERNYLFFLEIMICNFIDYIIIIKQ
jgi:hypothetical protein